MRGHIKLGAPGALRDYLLVDPSRYAAMAANPMAARVSSGGKYGEIEAWSTWVQEDWQMGVGQRDPDAGGFLYSDLDSRVPRQLITAPAMNYVPPQYLGSMDRGYIGHLPIAAEPFFTKLKIGTGQRYTEMAVKFKTLPVAESEVPGFWGGAFYGLPDVLSTGGKFSYIVYEDDEGEPGDIAMTGGGTIPLTLEDLNSDDLLPGYQWVVAAPGMSDRTLEPDTFYWFSIKPIDGTITLVGSTENDRSPGMAARAFDTRFSNNEWVNSADFQFLPFFLCFLAYHAAPYVSMFPSAFVRGVSSFPGSNANKFFYITQCHIRADTVAESIVVKIMETQLHDEWTLKDMEVGELSSKHVALFDGTIYFALGGKMAYYPVAGSAITTTATDAHGFETWNGYLWRYYNNNIYYSADGSTWTGPIEIGSTDYAVRSMCGMDQQMYVATDEALWMIAPGDFAVGIMRWGSVSSENGADMINHQNALYIAVGGRVVRFTPDGTAQDIFTSRDDDLVRQQLGRVVGLVGMNTHIVALVQAQNDYSGAPSAWAYNGQGWHHITSLPTPCINDLSYNNGERTQANPSAGIYYDYGASKSLWISPTSEWAFKLALPDYALNPYNDQHSRFMPAGWIETPKYYGGQVELSKDWESVRVWGDIDGAGTGYSGERTVGVYWQDEGTNTTGSSGLYVPNWEFLGEVTADGQELRWSDYTTRPNSRWIRLALLPFTNIVTNPPRVEAVAVKFLPMVTDRERWQLAIQVSPEQEMLDGEINTYTVAQQLAHLREMVQRVPPVIFEDIDGTQYEVKVVNASRNVAQFDVLPDDVRRIQYVYQVTLEQVTDGTYSA